MPAPDETLDPLPTLQPDGGGKRNALELPPLHSSAARALDYAPTLITDKPPCSLANLFCP